MVTSHVLAILLASCFALLQSVHMGVYDQVCTDYSRDCERRADLCYTKVDLMHRSCPKTCNVCSAAAAAVAAAPAAAPSAASALVHFSAAHAAAAPPKMEIEEESIKSSDRSSDSSKSRRPSKKCRDIASDCDETADLCDHASFKKMMKKQSTCGFCHPGRSTSSSSRGGKNGGSSIGGGGGGEGDLFTISGLAGVGESGDLGKSKSIAKGNKPKSVDGLSIPELVKLIKKAEETSDTVTACADMAYDCPIKQGLCGNARYSKLMLKMCMRTCNLCTTTTT